MQPAVSVLIGGILPFGAVFVELFFILSSLWLHQVYVSGHCPNSGPLTASARLWQRSTAMAIACIDAFCAPFPFAVTVSTARVLTVAALMAGTTSSASSFSCL